MPEPKPQRDRWSGEVWSTLRESYAGTGVIESGIDRNVGGEREREMDGEGCVSERGHS